MTIRKTSPRRAREIARTRDDIIEAAGRAFARKGYDATTMADIAREAGYSAPSLYSYFDGKQEIFAALVELLTDESLAVFDEPEPAGLGFRQRLELLIGRQLELAERRRDTYRLFFQVLLAGGQRPELPGPDAYIQRMVRWFRDAARREKLGPHGPDELALFLFGIQHGFFMHAVTGKKRGRLATRAPLVLDFFFHGARLP